MTASKCKNRVKPVETAMEPELPNDFNDGYALGKGEVESSILSGSTILPKHLAPQPATDRDERSQNTASESVEKPCPMFSERSRLRPSRVRPSKFSTEQIARERIGPEWTRAMAGPFGWLLERHDNGGPPWRVPACDRGRSGFSWADLRCDPSYTGADPFGRLSARDMIPSWAATAMRDAEKRAAKRGAKFGLSMADMVVLVWRSKGKCEVTGMRFDFEPHPKGWRRPFVPSLDRIDSTNGYTAKNCRIVTAIANIAMNEWGEGVLWQMAESMTAYREQGLVHAPHLAQHASPDPVLREVFRPSPVEEAGR